MINIFVVYIKNIFYIIYFLNLNIKKISFFILSQKFKILNEQKSNRRFSERISNSVIWLEKILMLSNLVFLMSSYKISVYKRSIILNIVIW